MMTVKEYAKATNKSTSTIYSRIKKNPEFADKTGKVTLLTPAFVEKWGYSDGFHLTTKAAEKTKEVNNSAEYEKQKTAESFARKQANYDRARGTFTEYYSPTTRNSRTFSTQTDPRQES
jgi:hypothetical protein